jgi:plastocyanin
MGVEDASNFSGRTLRPSRLAERQPVTRSVAGGVSGPTKRSLLGVVVAAALAMAACGSGQAAAAPAAQAAATPTPTPSAAATQAPLSNPVAATSVSIANFAFSPAAVTVKAGATITWTNQDEDAHTVALAGMPVSQPLQTGDTYTHTFTQPGTFSYICSIHPFMRGIVIVTAG